MKKKKVTKNLYSPPTKIRKKRIFIISFFIILAFFYFDYLLNLNHYKSKFENIIRDKTGMDVKIAKVRLKLFQGPAVSLYNLNLADPEKDQPLFHADKVLCKFNLKDIIKKNKLHFDSITFQNPQVVIYSDNTKKFTFKKSADSEKKNIDTTTQIEKNILSFLPKIKALNFDKSAFVINKVIAHNGSLTIIYPGNSEKTVINNISLVCQKVERFLTLTMEGQPDKSAESKILCKVTSDLINAKNFSTIKDKLFNAPIDMSLSVNSMNVNNISNPLKLVLPENMKTVKINISARSRGIPAKSTEVSGRINPINLVANQETNADFNIRIQWDKKLISLRKFITNIYKTDVQADGYYSVSSNKGEFYCYSKELGLESMRFVLPFLKSIKAEGTGRLYSMVKVNSLSSPPDISGNVYLNKFTGYFKNLSKPVILREPITGKFTSRDIVFDRAQVEYGSIPLLLSVKYIFLPEEKLYLDLDKLYQVQILDLMPYSANDTHKSPVADQAETKKDATENDVMDEHNAVPHHSNHEKKSHYQLPTYLTANIKDSFLDNAKIDTMYLDAFFEGKRMLFKNIDIRLYDGEMRGNGVIDFKEDSPEVSFVADIENIELNDLLTQNTDFKNIFWGKLTSAISFQCSGKTAQTISQKLRGQGTLKIEEGRISNLSLIKQILQRLSNESDNNKLKLLGSTIGLNLPPIEELELDNETKFQQLFCDFKIDKNDFDKNAFHAKELKILSPTMTISMDGNFDFEKKLDFKGDILLSKIETIKMLHKIKELGILFNIKDEQMIVPFKLKGTLDEPKPSPVIKISNVSNIWENVIQEKLLKKDTPSADSKNDLLKVIKDNEGLLNLNSQKLRDTLNKITQKQDAILDNDTINRLKTKAKSESINIDENDIKKFESADNGIIKLDETDMQKIQKLQKKIQKYLKE